MADIAHFDRAGDTFPPGLEFTFDFLRRSIYRRSERAERLIEREKGLKARRFLKEGEKYRKEHEQRIREGRGSGPWALAAADDVDDVEQKRKGNRQRKNAERKAKIAEEKKKKAAGRCRPQREGQEY